LPVTSFMTAPPDPLMLPSSSPIRQGFDQMQTGFGGGSTAPITVLVTSRTPLDTPDVSEAVVALERRLTALPSVDRVESALPALTSVASTSPLTALQPSVRSQLPPDVAAFVGHYVSTDGSRLVLDVIPTGPSEQSTRELLEAARRAAASAGIPAATVQVGGEPADGLAVGALLADTLPRVIAVMLALSYLLLLVTWRSVLLPLKAVLVNLLWVGASVAILVALCQRGFGAPVLGVDGPAWMYGAVPVVLVVLLFSLDLSHELLVVRRAPVAVPTALTAADLSAEWVLEDVELQPAESRR
jgi:RND superfamily putative drug exporter